MLDDNYVLAIEIKNKIQSEFPNADIDIFFDKEQDEYFISTRNKSLYYSEEFGMFILELNQNILWNQGIFNFFFILDVKKNKNENFISHVYFDKTIESSYFLWDSYQDNILSMKGNVKLNNLYLAA